MPKNPDINLGMTDEQGDDRFQCLAIDLGLSKEEVTSWALGIGATVLEIAAGNPETRIWVLNGDNSRFISMPTRPVEAAVEE